MKSEKLQNTNSPKLISLIFGILFCLNTAHAAISVKFSVDLSKMVSQSKFNPTSDLVYIKSTFNSWGSTNPLILESNNIYSTTIQLAENRYYEYKFFITTAGAENGGMERNFPVAQSGNRKLSVTFNNLVLPIPFFNDADMILGKTTAHFNFYYTSQENAVIDGFAQRLENNVHRILSALECAIPQKVNIYIYKDLKNLHSATGYYESSDWATGSAWGKSLITILSPVKFDYNASVEVLVHEFIHVANSWKTTVQLTNWISEGVACYYARQHAAKNDIASLINTQGSKRTLQQIETDFSVGGYPYSYTIAYFIAKKFGEHALANFVGNMDYTALGYTDKLAFQTGWHQFLDVYTDTQTKVTVKFSVDMSNVIQAGNFNPVTNHVYLKGSFNNWGTSYPMNLESGNVYSITIPLTQYSLYDYKFCTDAPNAPNGGWELTLDESIAGNRLLDLQNVNVTLNTKLFKNSSLILTNSINQKSYEWGATFPITWNSTAVSNIKIEYSSDNGTTWNLIKESVSATPGAYNWTVPNVVSSNCVIKITDKVDNTTSTTSGVFAIGNPVLIGGPYTMDANTMALLHFDNNLINESSPTTNALALNTVTFEPNPDLTMNSCIKISNVNTSMYSCVIMPYSSSHSMDNSWTIEMWFKISSWGSGTVAYPVLISKPGLNYYINLDASGKRLCGGFDYDGGTDRVWMGTNTLSLNNWYHIAFSRNTANATLNCILHDSNRQLVGTNSIGYIATHLPKMNTDIIHLGGFNFSSNVQFDGYIDELRISNVVRNSSTTDVTQVKGSGLFSVFPNPSIGVFNIKGFNSLSSTISIQVLNLNGQIIYEKNENSNQNISIDLRNKPKGLYLLKILDNSKCQTEKIIINSDGLN